MGTRPSLILLLSVIIMTMATCTPNPPPAPSRYAPTKLPPILPTGDFAAYIEASRARAVAINRSVSTELTPGQIEAIGPFQIKPSPIDKSCNQRSTADYDKGVLLIHGLNDTPYSMRDLADRFAKACYMVRAILLPGHGTIPGDLIDISLPSWRDAVAKAVWGFRGHVDRLVLVGLDLGANLALDVAHDLGFPPELELDGIVMLAPAFRYAPPQFSPAAAGPGGDALWGDVFLESEADHYKSTVRPSVQTVNKLGQQLFERDAPLHVPLLVVASDDDAASDPEVIQRWFCGQVSTPRKLLWYTRYPCRPLPNCRCIVRNRDPSLNRREVCVINRSIAHDLSYHIDRGAFSRETPKDCSPGHTLKSNPGILDLSHAALLAAPDNPRYGAASGRRDCLHYSWERETPEQKVCVGDVVGEGERYLRYGETSGGNLRNYILRRLTYNPDFDFMVAAILDFLERTD